MYELDKPCIVYREDCPLYEKEGDGMTNEKAIEELKGIKSAYSDKHFDTARLMRSEHEALDMAIQALEQEPCDLISRQAVIDLISNFILEIHSEGGRDLNAHTNDVLRQILRNVGSDRVLPSVNPQEPKTGRGLHLSQRFKDWQFIQEPKTGYWIPVSERLPETDNENSINNYDVLLWVKNKSHPEREPQIYLGKLKHIDGDDGSGNFWGIETKPCDWAIWGWSYFNEPEVIAWMPLPKPYEPQESEEV